MKKITQMTFFLIFYIGCSSQHIVSDGGQDLGGGDHDNQSTVSESMIIDELKNFEKHKFSLFRTIEMTGLISNRILNIEQKMTKPFGQIESEEHRQNIILSNLFSNKKNDELLKKINIEYRTDNVCLDKNGQAHDGSIYSKLPFGICIDIKRLSKKLNKTNYQLELLALYIHELSHLYGSTETEAIQIQKKIKSLGGLFKKYLSYLKNENDFDQKMTNLVFKISDINLIKKTDDRDMKNAYCKKIDDIYDLSTDIFTNYNVSSQEILKLDLKKIISFHAVFVIAGYSKDFCVSDSNPLKNFKKQKYVSVEPDTHHAVQISKLYPDPLFLIPTLKPDEVLKLSQYLLADLSLRYVNWVDENDFTAFSKNITQLKTLAELLKN